MKKCSKCKKKQSENNFNKNKQNKDGLDCYCKSCKAFKNKKYYENNTEIVRENRKDYYWKHRIQENKGSKRRYQKKVTNNPNYGKEQYSLHKEETKAYVKKYEKEKLLVDENLRIVKRLRSKLKDFIKGGNSKTTERLVGCTSDELRKYLENLFKPGMTWENYGQNGWVVDHYWPICEFDLTDPQQQLACFNFRNLQPLWYEENKKKGRKLL